MCASYSFWGGVHRSDLIGAPLLDLGKNGWMILEAERYLSAAVFTLAGFSRLWKWKKELVLLILGLLFAAGSQVANRNWHRAPDFGGMIVVSRILFWICGTAALLLLVSFVCTCRMNFWGFSMKTSPD